MLEKYITKKFNIDSSVELSYKENVYEKSKVITPKSVSVSGGESQVDRISKAVLMGEEKDITSNISKSYDIKFLDALGNEVSDIEPSSLNAQMDVIVANGKSVPIKLKTIGKVQDGYVIENSTLSQTYVNISGEDSLLENIDKIETQYVDISNLTSNNTITTKLNVPEGITLQNSEETIEVTFTIGRETMISKEVLCDVDYINIPEGFVIENSTQAVKVNLNGLKNQVDLINANNIKVTVDLASVSQEGTFTYTPEVRISTPNNVTITDIENTQVTINSKT